MNCAPTPGLCLDIHGSFVDNFVPTSAFDMVMHSALEWTWIFEMACFKLIVGSRIASIQRKFVTAVYAFEGPAAGLSFRENTVNELITASTIHKITFRMKKLVKPMIDVFGMNEKT